MLRIGVLAKRTASEGRLCSPRARGEVNTRSRSRDAFFASELSARTPRMLLPPNKSEGRRSAEKRNHWSRIFGCGARLALGALAFRRSTAALAEVSRPRLFDFRPGFLGRGSRRRYPPCACPSPAAAPRTPAVIPADMMPEAARERFARPPAGTAPTPHLQIASGMRPSMGGLGCSATASVIAVKDE
jgi:hypothetical protein